MVVPSFWSVVGLWNIGADMEKFIYKLFVEVIMRK